MSEGTPALHLGYAITVGPDASGNDELCELVRHIVFAAAEMTDTRLVVTDALLPEALAVVDAGFVRDGPESGGILGFPTAYLTLATDHRVIGVEFFDVRGQAVAATGADDHVDEILRRWLLSLTSDRGAANTDDWRHKAEVLLRSISGLVANSNQLVADLQRTRTELAIAESRIAQLENIRDLLLTELARVAPGPTRSVVSSIAKTALTILSALAVAVGAEVAAARLATPQTAAAVVVEACDDPAEP